MSIASEPRLGVSVAVWLFMASACGGGPSSDAPGSDAAQPVAGAAEPADEISPSSAVEPAGTWVFTCADGDPFSARLDADSAYVDLGVQAFSLPRVEAGSGARYSDGGRELWSSGASARVTLPGVGGESCGAVRADGPWERAALVGVDFRGLGQEPGWIVDIDLERRILYVGDYATVRFATPVPEPSREASGEVSFDVETEAHHLLVRITPTPCNDSMSGQPFSHTVRLRVDGRELSGCGRFVGELVDFGGEVP